MNEPTPTPKPGPIEAMDTAAFLGIQHLLLDDKMLQDYIDQGIFISASDELTKIGCKRIDEVSVLVDSRLVDHLGNHTLSTDCQDMVGITQQQLHKAIQDKTQRDQALHLLETDPSFVKKFTTLTCMMSFACEHIDGIFNDPTGSLAIMLKMACLKAVEIVAPTKEDFYVLTLMRPDEHMHPESPIRFTSLAILTKDLKTLNRAHLPAGTH